MSTKIVLQTTALLLIGVLLPGCDLGGGLICGETTFEKDGKCEASTVLPPAVTCGPGTDYDPESGQCVSHWYEALPCDPETTVVQVNDEGHPWCVGTGVVGDCSTQPAPPCPAPSAGRVSICGRIFDMATSGWIDEETAAKLTVEAFDAVARQADPNAPVLLSVEPDRCGYFVAPDILQPAMSYVVIGTSDRDGLADPFSVVAGVLVGTSAGQTLRDVRMPMVTRALDAQWTADAGDPFDGDTFSDVGTLMTIFVDRSQPAVSPHEGTPAAGVVVTLNGVPATGSDFYFSDDNPIERLHVSPSASATGANGAGLFVAGPIGQYGGQGGEPGCNWPSVMGATAPGSILLIEDIEAGGTACP